MDNSQCAAWAVRCVPVRRKGIPRVVLAADRTDVAAWAMRRHRVNLAELHQAVRSTGTGDLASVAAVVLETDGTMSVISTSRSGDRSALSEGLRKATPPN